ncbi:MAG: MYG1 family protein [Patescibacteria group bacterium]
MNFSDKKTLNLVTHSSNFHADDIFATSVLKIYFAYAYPKIKLSIQRSIDPKVIQAADIVYDIGKIYDTKKLRFDHHQTGGADTRENGIRYAAFGLVWKHFGLEVCKFHTEKISGKKATSKQAAAQFSIVEKTLVSHIDGMDNGQLTYKELYTDVVPLTFDRYFQLCKISASAMYAGDIVKTNKAFDTEFFKLVETSIEILKNILTYAFYKEQDESKAIKAYEKAVDKRLVIADRFYYFNFAKFPEPLVIVYPDARGGWAAKVVEKEGALYDARFYFPKEWAGLTDGDLEKVSGVSGAQFCHNARFLATADTKKGVLELVHKAFVLAGI